MKKVLFVMLGFVLVPAVLYAGQGDMLEYFGEEVISCIFIQDLRDTIKSGRDSVVWEIWKDDEIQAFWKGPEKQFRKIMEEIKEESGIDIKEAFDNLVELRGGIGIGFYGINFDEDIAESLIVMTGIPGSRMDYFGKTVKKIFDNAGYGRDLKEQTISGKEVTALQSRNRPSFYIWENGHDLLISFSKRPMEIAIRSSAAGKADQKLKKTAERFRESRGAGLIAYGNMNKAISHFESLKGEAQGDISEILDMLSPFGVRDLDTVAVHTAFRERGFYTGFAVSVKPGAKLRMYTCERIRERDLKKIPASAVSFSAFTIDPEYTYDTIIKSFSMYTGDPEIPEYQEIVRELKEKADVSVREELVKSLTGKFLVYSYSPSLIFAGDPGVVIRAELRYRRPLRKLIAYFMKENADNEEISISSIRIKGRNVYTMAMPGLLFHPTVVINRSELIIATTKDAAAAAISDPEKNILEHPEYTRLEEHISSKEAFLVSYADARSIIDRAYSISKTMLHIMYKDMDMEYVDLSKIPTAHALTRNMFGAKYIMRKTGNDIVGEAYAPLEYFILNSFLNGFVVHFGSIMMMEDLFHGRF